MRSLTILISLGLAVCALANSPDWAVGSYRLDVSPDLKAAAQKLGVPEPSARIMLRPDGTFTYASNKAGAIAAASGTYGIDDHQIHLDATGLFPEQQVKTLRGQAKEGVLEIEGQRYLKSGAGFEVAGAWFVQNDGRIDRSIKMVFNSNRTFEFVGMAASSKGKYEVEGDRLTLSWTEVDGQPVQSGSMRKRLILRDDGTFNIDGYLYVRP